MLIDWFTVGAQVVNFLILVWLLKRFLYHPVLDAIDARERRIAGELAQADATRADAERERDRFHGKSEDIDHRRSELLRQATAEANAERQRLLDEARKAAAELSARRQESLRLEALQLQQALTQRAQQEVFSISRKTLADLADTELEGRMVAVLARRLRDLSAADRAALGAVFKDAPTSISVRSAFELPAAARAELAAAIEQTLGVVPSLRFETVPELIGGIELSTDGQRLAWSIAGYLASLQAGVDDVLKGQTQMVAAALPGAAPHAAPASGAPADAN